MSHLYLPQNLDSPIIGIINLLLFLNKAQGAIVLVKNDNFTKSVTTMRRRAIRELCALVSERVNDGFFATQEYGWKEKSADEETRKYSDKLRDVYALAERLGCSFGQLAIAWSLKNESVQCLLLGASNIDQLYESLQSLQVTSELFVSRGRPFALCAIF